MNRAITTFIKVLFVVGLAVSACGDSRRGDETVRSTSQAVTACVPFDPNTPPWIVGKFYHANDLALFNGKMYQCRQQHTSQSDWIPTLTPALWQIPTPCGATGWDTQTAYAVGSVVTFNGVTYQCTIAHTSQVDWTPDQTPALWKPVRRAS
jgi:hypothetical protein